jgi:hypothetical protein
MATLAELAEHGIQGQADVLPVPVGPEPLGLTSEREREIGTLDLLAMMPEKSAVVVSGHLAALLAEVRGLRARVAELEAQRERRRVRLVALQNDALNMRGSLSPTGEDRKVPFPLGETLTPAVEWLIARVTELEAAPRQVFRASHDSIVMGLYTTREAAQEHCEAKVRQEEPAGSIRHLSWSADDIGDQAEYELHITPAETGGLIRGTGYVVTPLTVASEYDAEADE